jgi:hypothetical protein
MPLSTVDLAWWVMTGAIAALLSLITLMVGVIGYLLKTGFDRMASKFDEIQHIGIQTREDVAVHKAACKERHERLDFEIVELRGRP